MGIHCAFCSHTGNEEGRSACAETESSLSALSRPRPDVGSSTNQLCLQRKKQYFSVKMANGNMANKCKKEQHSECVINLDGSCFNTASAKADKPLHCLRMSVTPAASHIFVCAGTGITPSPPRPRPECQTMPSDLPPKSADHPTK